MKLGLLLTFPIEMIFYCFLFVCLFRSFYWSSSCVWRCYWLVWSAWHCQVSCNHLQILSAFYCYSSLLCAVILLTSNSYLSSSSSSSPSVCGSLADVFLDGQCHGSWAVHSSQWALRLLAGHKSCHSAAVLDATGAKHHLAQSPRVDAHGNVTVVFPGNGINENLTEANFCASMCNLVYYRFLRPSWWLCC